MTRSCSSTTSSACTSGAAPGGVFDATLVERAPGFACLRVSGSDAAEAFAAEPGGHRWQRVPPTEKRGRVHTSTVTVAVLPVLAENELTLDGDVAVWTSRGSGPGGQHRNKTESRVVARHLPTGIVVRCNAERSQHRNRELALETLAARVAETGRRAALDREAGDRRRQVGSGQRGDKRRTIRVRDGIVTDHVAGWRLPLDRYLRGEW